MFFHSFLLLLVSSMIIRSRNSFCVPSLDSRSLMEVEWTTKDLLSDWKSLCRYTRHGQSIIISMGWVLILVLDFGLITWIKPYLMMESGAFKGHSTWVLHTLRNEKYLKKGPSYVDGNCSVMKKHGVTDLSRIEAGGKIWVQSVKHLIFEDNYDLNLGDHYSLRHM
ncbi:hypothetical protein MKW92_051248 [Papaver armeniacum]|nr:hypothetical protein MKW92_051248 [Papaver armeniacum]